MVRRCLRPLAEQPSPWAVEWRPPGLLAAGVVALDVRDRAALGVLCRFAAAQTARTSASRLTANWSVPLGSQQTAASHAAHACAAMSYASSSRPAALCGS